MITARHVSYWKSLSIVMKEVLVWKTLLDFFCTWLASLKMNQNTLSSCLNLPTFNSPRPSDACMRQQIRSALVQLMTCHLFSAEPFPEPAMRPLGSGWQWVIFLLGIGYICIAKLECWPLETNLNVFFNKIHSFFYSRQFIWKYRQQNTGHFVSVSMW